VKESIAIIGLTIIMVHACHSNARVPENQSQNLVLEAVVEKVGEAPGVGSGFHAVYQLAKYKLTSVCEGEYEREEIIVDHLMLYGDELDKFRPGDKVRLVIKPSNTIFNRNNEEGFRRPHDKVEVFFIGEKPKLLSPTCAPCQPCQDI
jgi:hypothetical protein